MLAAAAALVLRGVQALLQRRLEKAAMELRILEQHMQAVVVEPHIQVAQPQGGLAAVEQDLIIT
jgi:hypothetical protein